MNKIRITIPALVMISALAMPAMTRADDTIQQLALTLLAQKFDIDPKVAANFQRSSGQNVFDAAPVYSTSHYIHRPVNEVWKLRQQGLGWGEIAHRLGMNPGQFNKLRKSGAFDRDAIWNSIYRDRYGARQSDLAAIRRRGASPREALPTFVIARASRTSPSAVYSRYQKERDWDRTAGAYKVDLRNPARSAIIGMNRVQPAYVVGGHRRIPVEALGRPNGENHGNGRGKGRGHHPAAEKEHGHVDKGGGHSDRGRGHDDDEAKDGGKGHGRGTGHRQGDGNGGGHGKGRDRGDQ